MRIFIKILKISLASLVSVIALLIIVSAIMEPQISRIFFQKVNQGLNTRAEVEKINFSLLRNFPQASVDLSNLVVFSPVTPGIVINPGEGDTLISAAHLFVSLKITGLLRKDYIVDKISIDKGRINITEDSKGKTNLDIFKSTGQEDTSALTIELRSIRIENSYLRINSSLRDMDALLFISEADNRVSLAPSAGRIDLNATLNIINLRVKKYFLPQYDGRIKTSAEFSFNSEEIQFDMFSLNCDEAVINASGKAGIKTGRVSADFTLSPTSVSDLLKLSGLNLAETLKSYGLKGTLSATGNIEKPGNTGVPANISIMFSADKGRLAIPGVGQDISDITAIGTFSFNTQSPGRTSLLEIENLTASSGISSIKASGSIKNFYSPQVDLIFSGELETSDITLLLKLKEIKSDGKIRSNIRLYGSLPHRDKFIAEDLLLLNKSANLSLQSVTIRLPGNGITAERIKGNIMLADNIWFDGITFSIAGSQVAMNGRITGAESWIRNRRGDLTVTAGIWSDRLSREMISSLYHKENKKEGGGTFDNTRLSMNLDVRLDSLVIDKFRASMFTGELSYSNHFFNVSSFSLNSLGGFLSGNVALAELSGGYYLGKGFFNIDKIDINNTFRSLNNFGQSYITDSNLRGNLTGSFSISSELDSLFRPDLNTLQASGKYIISNGELVGFEPVLKLSRFVDLAELQDIKFSELRNDLVIKNRLVTIPSMDIKSSAFSLAISGDHSFEGNYTYHLKLLLSDLLNRKSKAGREPSNEFGVIEQDGLGNTSLHLKIEGTLAGSKVSYDIKNLRGDVKKDVEQEKVTLKTILREEYGWYAGDSIPATPKSETRKFRITWEEADSIRIDETEKEEKGLPLKKLLKKKKSGEGFPF